MIFLLTGQGFGSCAVRTSLPAVKLVRSRLFWPGISGNFHTYQILARSGEAHESPGGAIANRSSTEVLHQILYARSSSAGRGIHQVCEENIKNDEQLNFLLSIVYFLFKGICSVCKSNVTWLRAVCNAMIIPRRLWPAT